MQPQARHPSRRSSRRELERDARGLVVASLFWIFFVVGTFCVAKGMSVTLLQRTTSTDFWIFQLVGTVCVTKATFVTLTEEHLATSRQSRIAAATTVGTKDAAAS